MYLPPYPIINRILFKLFPYTFLKLFPPQINPHDPYDCVDVPDDVEGKIFDKPIEKRMWRKRFPELRKPFPKIGKRTKLRVPDDPLPGEFAGPVWRLKRRIEQIRFRVHCWRLELEKNRRRLSLS